MNVEFTCPHCGVTTTIESRYAGQSGNCAACGKPITIPTPDARWPQKDNERRSAAWSLLSILGGLFGLAVMLALVVSLVFLVVPATRLIQSSTAQQACSANLQRIGQAMLAYHAAHGTFPPAVVNSADGKPMHSWRVLLLPYLGQADLYKQYDLNEPWDGPANQYLAAQMPSVYACPDDANLGSETSYLVVNGPGFVFNGPQTTSRTQITDGPSQTILVVEAPTSGVNWMEPRDLSATGMNMSIGSQSSTEIGSHHLGGGANLLFADGKVQNLPNSTPAQFIEAMLTIDQADGAVP